MADLSSMRGAVLGLFPWLAHVSVSSVTKALAIQSANKLIELAGGGPQVLRVPDVMRFVFDPGVSSTGPGPALYGTLDGDTFTLIAQVAPGSTVGGTVAPPPGTTTTAIAPTGSERVTCG